MKNTQKGSGGPSFIAAMDVGGTKTVGFVADAEGNIIASARDRGITPVDAPASECVALYTGFLRRLFDSAGVTADATYCSIAAIEHYTPDFQNGIAKAVGDRAGILRAEPDGLCLISGMLGHADGASMVCGTGSSLYVRSGEDWFRVGGWGHLIDSCGSGFVLGRLAIRAVLREYDGRGEKTLLTPLCEEKCGRPIPDDYDRIYSLGRPYVASYAGCVFEARRRGDAVASKIFDDCAADMAELIATALRRTGKKPSELPLFMNGGIFAHWPEYPEAILALAPAGVRASVATVPPVYGCAVEAMYSLGLGCTPAFRAKLLDGIARAGLA